MNVGTRNGYTIRDGENVIKVSTEGLTDFFMWNPQDNAGKTPSAWSDMEPGDGDKFAGVEPGYFHEWKRLSPGEEFVGSQTLSVA
ncbi:hypothetical protein EHS25_004910 [Saitozyma podzolica]|uniref:Uncharacterized protein n=1 Tax=Saitozyma podzolica TaxID=1890683 RepID=A0A427Y318_9TREE|nr:hypothetical protein EHS25_004910 [Saitozyma podzolica]